MSDPKQAPRVEVGALLARLDAIRASLPGQQRSVVAMDGDHTLWRGDISDALFATVVGAQGVRDEPAEALAAEAARHGIDVAGRSPSGVAWALFEAFQAGRYPEPAALEMMVWVYAGWTLDELDRAIEETFARIDLAGALRRELLQLIAWADAGGVESWLVSASPQFLVDRAAEVAGIARDRVVGTRPVMHGRTIGASIDGTPSYAEGKWRRLEERIGGASLLAAFGDSAFDAALLRAAHVGVGVAPREGLRRELSALEGAVELVVGAPPGELPGGFSVHGA